MTGCFRLATDPRAVGPELEASEERLSRVVVDLKGKGGDPTRGAFMPSKSNFKPSSDGGLSTKREMQAPAEVFEEYVASGRSAVGVWSVSVLDFKVSGLAAARCNLPVHADGGYVPVDGGDPYPDFHASVWYPMGVSRGVHERIAKEVLTCAKQVHPEMTAV